MRRRTVVILMVTVLATMMLPAKAGSLVPNLGPQPAPLAFVDPGVGGFMSSNVSYVATLPNESPGVSARVVPVGDQTRFYVSNARGLSVYDVTDPGLPLLLGTLDLHNWENEDIAVSADGKTILMSDFEGVAYLMVVSVTDLPGGFVALTITGVNAPGGNHTVECLDDPCDWAYGSEGDIYDLRDKADPKIAGKWSAVTGGGGHHITRDANGLIWTDTTPIFVLNPWPDPVHPTIVARSDRPAMQAGKTAYQHNNLRPFAAEYQQRVTEEDVADPNLRPGEILLGEGETNTTVTCGAGSGPFVTYDLRNFDTEDAAPFKPVDVFRPINGDYQNGDPAVNTLGCSGHWFDISPASTHEKIVTANAWYEHGTRILEVDGATGEIGQVGYFQPVVGSASAAYWIDDEYIYVVDYERGIDILRFNPDAPLPTKKQFRNSWLAKLNAVSPLAATERYFCSLAQGGR